ncbi:hypothetical protein M408DRAFT_333243 [Serendipita vermifera MAFF 305830]|uniref:C2H2-type domain-containing protein n=1 Tax=Serendipita vermifera MAFF 305830 TaxID=933852 RepID=A0A0C3ARA4_SERVB|nr:hypothetical protein M408DRAFT_333243 [Serendipita vermifera MAFF 305830]
MSSPLMSSPQGYYDWPRPFDGDISPVGEDIPLSPRTSIDDWLTEDGSVSTDAPALLHGGEPMASGSSPSYDHGLDPCSVGGSLSETAMDLGGNTIVNVPSSQRISNNRQRKFICPELTCSRTFDRKSRLQDCKNGHLKESPHICAGACGNPSHKSSPKRYRSLENLERHILPKHQRCRRCPSCNKSISKQNFARHMTRLHGRDD